MKKFIITLLLVLLLTTGCVLSIGYDNSDKLQKLERKNRELTIKSSSFYRKLVKTEVERRKLERQNEFLNHLVLRQLNPEWFDSNFNYYEFSKDSVIIHVVPMMEQVHEDCAP